MTSRLVDLNVLKNTPNRTLCQNDQEPNAQVNLL